MNMDEIDREKTIKGLENTSSYFRHLQSVGFFGDQEIYYEHEKHCNDAIALLKEQEPHVLSREEMIEAGKNHVGVYVEEYPNACRKDRWAIAIEGIEPPEHGFNYPGGIQFNAVDADDDMYDGDLYCVNGVLGWRAWSSKPTKEQMNAVPW